MSPRRKHRCSEDSWVASVVRERDRLRIENEQLVKDRDTWSARAFAQKRVIADLLNALGCSAFQLQPISNQVLCRRCGEPIETHSPDHCEVAAAMKIAEASR